MAESACRLTLTIGRFTRRLASAEARLEATAVLSSTGARLANKGHHNTPISAPVVCRETGDAAATRAQLATLFELAAYCTEAKLAEAALQLAERDYSGVVALTAQVSAVSI